MFHFHWYQSLQNIFPLISQNLFLFSIGIIIWYHMFWYVFLICKGSLTSSLYIDSCCVYHILRSLIALLNVLHVCRRSFTSPFMHCILCVMWLGSSYLFFIWCMYAGGVNFTSFLFMNVYRIYLSFMFDFCCLTTRKRNFWFIPLCWWLTKRGRNICVSYACLLCLFVFSIDI